MATFEELEAKIRAFPGGFTSGGGALQAEIDAAAGELEFQIRGGYRRFLQTFGWLEIAYDEVWGLGGDVPGHLQLQRLTESERAEMRPRLARHLLPFSNDGAGNLYCLDMIAPRDEPPVVLWLHEHAEDQAPEPAAASFADWAIERLDMRLDDLP